MITNSIPYLDQVLRYNDALLGLPALPLVFISCLALGYAAKACPFVPNRHIPLVVLLGGTLGNIVLGLGGLRGPMQSVTQDIARQSMLGLIVSCVAWYVHSRYLKKFESTDNDPPKP